MADVKLLELPEADGWIFQHEDTGLMTTLENDGINNPDNFKENNPRHVLCEAIYSERKLHTYARDVFEANRAVVDEAMVQRALGPLPAEITNPEAWPPNYADGFNEAMKMVCEFMRAALTAAVAQDGVA